MGSLIRSAALAGGVLLALVSAAPGAIAQDSAGKVSPPPGFTAPDLPKPDETNAQRDKTQPGNNAPFWRAVRESGSVEGSTTLPNVESGSLIQPFVQYPGAKLTNAGEAWRQVRNQWIIPYGGSMLLIVALAMALFYWRKGALGGHSADTGRVIERFTYFERAAHWTNAIAFCVLAISGLVMAFGKFFILPVIGSTLFGWLAYALKTAHNFAGPLFAVSLLVVLVTFVRDNIPSKSDLTWLAKGGGLLGSHEVPSHRFNAGEKVIFWAGVFVLGLTVVGSGLVMDKLVPGLAYTRGDMQIAHMIHAGSSVLMMVLFMGHIYLGTIGMKGAFRAMRSGRVDEAWAREHHELWYDDIKAGKIPAQRTPVAGSAGSHAAQH